MDLMERFSTCHRRSLRPGTPPQAVHAGLHASLPVCESSRSGGHTAGFHRFSKERYRLSFFDEVDEPPRTETRTTPRASSRSAPRRRRPSGTGGRRPPGGDQQSIQVRRAIAIGAVLVVIVLIALGVHGCEQSATDSALQDYTNNVSSLIKQSDTTGSQLFSVLATAASAGNATSVHENITRALQSADTELNSVKALSVPSQVAGANQKLVFAFQMRANGIANIANDIEPALSTSANISAIDAIAAQTAQFYASDVVYKNYVVPDVYGALRANGTRFSGLPGGQFLPNVDWLVPADIANALHVTVPGLSSSSTKITPGTHGHQLNSVSVAGITLQTGSTNAIPAKPPATFTLNFANSGSNNETDVVCQVTVTGTSVKGQKIVPETFAGKNAQCQVTLSSAPPTGTYSVVARIEKVPGEKNLANNAQTFPVTFQ
jgi:hypothetical protein